MEQPIRTLSLESMRVEVYADRASLGKAAGAAVATKMRDLLSKREGISMVFAAADSQKELLEELARQQGIDWSRVTAFHMDEYLGVPGDAPQSFGRWLRVRLFDKVRPGTVHLMNGLADPAAECRRYSALLAAAPLDLCCLGIGENGHLAFNDPPVADFNDSESVKRVQIDEASQVQQAAEGNFVKAADVPKDALTLTIPALLAAPSLFCSVPGPRKAKAVRAALYDPITTACPATVLRRHAGTTVYLDPDSASLIDTTLARR